MTGGFSADGVEAYRIELLAAVAQGNTFRKITNLPDGRIISIVNQPLADGGWVATHEDITERLRAEEKIQHLAHFDTLTNLPNRVTFYERMETVLSRLRRSESIAVFSLDLDRFKSVNETLGHPIGDLLLQAAADRMRHCVRGEDLVARLGGDEFAIVQVASKQSSDVSAFAARLIEAVEAPYELNGHQVIVGASVGIAVAPGDGGKPDALMKSADMALSRAKADGGGVYRFFELAMDARMQARRALELDLRKAIVNGEFELYYQPIVDVKTTQITSCEALIRWHHPERGMIAPAEFISIAEETGLIVPLGEWVIRQACAEAVRWPKHVTVAVNLSPAQFKSRNLLPTIIGALATSGLPAGRLELEITELVLSGGQRRRLRGSAPAARSRDQDRDGRFRHRLFLARLPAPIPVRQDQDRPVLHPRPAEEGRQHRHHPRGRRLVQQHGHHDDRRRRRDERATGATDGGRVR